MGSPSIADQIAADLGPELCQDFNPNLLNVGQEGVVCGHALRGGDWVWLAQSLSPAG
jgi:hypothetical protein